MPRSYRLTDLAYPYLLASTDISFRGKCLYDLICRCRPNSLAEITAISGLAWKTVKKECESLKKHGWLKFEITKSLSTLIIPIAPSAVQTRLATDLTEYRRFWAWFGESLMKVMLDNTVQSSSCLDNCRPQRMSNPETGKALELDRLYFPNVAFEFQGRQHHQLTSMHKDEQHFERAKLLDLAKVGLAEKLGIQIVEITIDDLTIDGIVAKIPETLEIQRIDREGEYIQFIDAMGQDYIRTQTAQLIQAR